MRGHDLVGRTPTDVRWSTDSRWIYFGWNPPGTDWRAPLQPYRVRADAGAVPESLTVAQMDSAGPTAAAGELLGAEDGNPVFMHNEAAFTDVHRPIPSDVVSLFSVLFNSRW